MRIIILISLLWLTGCASVPMQQQPPQNQSIPWGNRVQTLSGIENWDLKALIAIRAAHAANSASLNWQQNKQNYTILLFGPLGTNSFALQGRPGQVQLQTANGKKFSAPNAETLITEQTGWQLPVSNLYYWIRGLPVPTLPAVKRYDSYNHLSLLNQQDWTIHYLSYVAVNNIDMPNKIVLENPQLRVKIIVTQWQL